MTPPFAVDAGAGKTDLVALIVQAYEQSIR
jgi:hypothetical protein